MSTRNESAGVTLFELLIVMSIVAILLALAVPSFRYVTQSNRSSSEINGLLGDLQFARAEAIKEGQTVTVCATNGGNACVGTTAWNGGWMVFSDTGVVGTFDTATDVLLRQQPRFTSTDLLTADGGTTLITFNRDGFAYVPSAMRFNLTTVPTITAYSRCLSVTIVGALTTQTSGGITSEGTTC